MSRAMIKSLARGMLKGHLGGRNYTTITQVAASALLGDDPDLPRIQDLRQGNKISPVFTTTEFERRITNLRQHMASRHIGGVVLTSYHNINYFSGFMYCAFGRNYALVITPSDCITVTAGIDGGQPHRRSYGDNITYTDWRHDNFFHTIRSLLSNVKGVVGLELDHVSVDNMRKFESTFPQGRLADIGEATMNMRLLKSQEEIELIKHGARVADLGAEVGSKTIKEGIAEYEVGSDVTRAMVKEIAKTFPGSEMMDSAYDEIFPAWTWFQTGINTDGAHNPLTTRRVKKGDILSLNCFPMIAGYYTAIERTMFLDHASDAHLSLWEINCQVHRRGIELIKPGVRCSDIAHELNDIYRRHGLLKYRSFGYGHSFGSLSHYYGREKALEIREDVDTVLVPGMVVSMEPMIMIPEGMSGAGGYREHDILVVKQDGAENITGFPYGPEHNIIKA